MQSLTLIIESLCVYQTVALLAVLSWVEVRWVRENYKQRKKREWEDTEQAQAETSSNFGMLKIKPVHVTM